MGSSFNIPIRQLAGGNAGLLICLLLYLAWWCIVFRPGGSSTALSTTCIILATIVGIAGVIMTLRGLSALPSVPSSFPNRYLLFGGIIVYAVLAISTYLLLKRPVTTELILIVGWTVLELSIIHSLSGNAILSQAAVIALTITLMAIVIASIVCYIMYYHLSAMAGFVDGAGPLIGGAAFQIIMVSTLLVITR